MSENIIDIHVSRILSKSSFNHTASSVFRQMLEKIPDPIFPTKKQQSNFQQIQDALEDFWITDRSLISIILPCLALADVNPFDCFDQFSSNLPEINQNTAPKKGTGGKTFYTDLLNDIDWDQPKNRLCGLSLNLMVLCYFFDLIISQVKLEDKLFNSSFIKLFFRIFNLFPKDTNEFYSTAYHKPAKFIAPTICKFTLNLDTKFTINTFDQIFGVEDKTHKIKASEALSSPMLEVYLYFFSQVNFGSTISNDLLSNAHKLLEKIRCVGNKVKDYDSSLHYAVLACMYNVVGLLFINDRTFSTSKIISEIYDFTLSLIKNSYYKGPAHALHTLIYVFADDNKNITMPIMKYINKYLKPLVGKPEFAGCFLQSIIILLRGKNYKQNSLLKLTGENFNWRTKKEFFGSDTRQFMVSSIFSSNNSACFVDYQTELSDFFLQYSSDPSSGFARDIFPKLMLESFKKNNMRSCH
ncbi:hypothetical protein GPJ56_004583 [Histomonas meleagridis]|uniref:uncharacterized protein n=1 Tax=Histomonas meleagridis TaxID=135588 RepID=UPI00355A5BB3|nr:hypothetical protein GPJ56_004583 [Histomonas meleagridis]KAH0800553.1 hypothetical protein GO595_006621 [Histomonas meleagridis]